MTITLSAPAPFPVDVFFQTTTGTATALVDYIPRQGWVHFDPAEVSKTVPIPVIGDTQQHNERIPVTSDTIGSV